MLTAAMQADGDILNISMLETDVNLNSQSRGEVSCGSRFSRPPPTVRIDKDVSLLRALMTLAPFLLYSTCRSISLRFAAQINNLKLQRV